MTWMQTRNGTKWDLLSPKIEDVDFHEIAHALSNLCRFNGHTASFYSVAEHSLHVSTYVEYLGGSVAAQLHGLLHDAHEAFLGDDTSPKQQALASCIGHSYRSAIELLKLTHDASIFRAANLNWTEENSQLVKRADHNLLFIERDRLFGLSPSPWVAEPKEPIKLSIAIRGYSPDTAKLFFLERFNQLTQKR